MKDKKIAVLGTGANGSCTAADLIRTGHDVVLIDQWPAHVETMRKEGLRIRMPEEEVHVPVRAYHLCDVATMTGKFDYVMLLVKAYDTRWAAELIKPYLADDGLLVGVQNAMTVDDIAEIVGPSRTVGCVLEMSSEIFIPGIVQRNNPPPKTWFGVGSLHPSTTGREEEIAALLRNVGKVSVSTDIMSAKWMKLVANAMCLGPLALAGINLYGCFNTPGVRELLMKAGTEALTAGQLRGHTIQPVFGLTPEEVKDTNRLLEVLLEKLTHDVGPAARDCVQQDHIKGRYSEVDMINGLVVEELARHGQKSPANAAVVEITRRIHAGEMRPDAANVQLALKMMVN